MADMIESRNETFKQFESLMRDVRDITGDIESQTKIQGEKMEVIDEDLGGAADNVEQANEQLAEKMNRERTGNKLLIWCVVIAVIICVCLIFFGFVNKGETVIEVEIQPPQPSDTNPDQSL
mmetsp:Transcript_21639/g.28982  ORF Transcript_21639/g.28982 Transcript_21639/m.28982 type:complete len:121 (+) Transcript_21639:689-1051(+)|eukprot:CAMPEP_0185579802 /NCGR_PEP_ID=MMETSP0434-20130131/15422_1 /TAXON_ID=626734 ORGANISM="Favella taraikaensis, Strain Fe Narragansett Bay" /NCGR_SAMPLE_ID=MMETSP0434 /ASSEMBLY_ACC=CAM_ASM_000379 /LENGTH=120 /DNA_ID=CAMNT_0028197901 /DNA_START=616 /DNA_END=978 /DNA_ORIENTATION=-